MEGKLIYSVKEIFTDYLNGKYPYYNIPEYQRGYKWDTQQIEQLLKDIDNFKPNGNVDKFYCIQNITIVEKEKNGKSFYNVVDGQQRLTTLVVLLSYLNESETIKNKLKYSVRTDTDNFIKLFILNNSIVIDNWKDFLTCDKKTTEISDYNHQDIFYLFSAYNTVKRWFENKDKRIFKEKLLNNVKLIVNKPDIDNEQELFMNLNTGKVSLDGADLVRALLITNVATEELKDDNLTDTKSIVRINERRVRIGLELDEISAWWNQPNVRDYFSFLNKMTVPDSETIDFNSGQYPIDLLYKLYLAKDSRKEICLQDFENQEYVKLYKKLISLHRTIKDWYQDCEIYHFVKYVITQSDTAFSTVWKDWTESKSRTKFVEKLTEKSKNIIQNFVSEIDNLDEDWFVNENNKLYKTLIISDIIQIVKSQKSENKLPFLPADYFRPKKEDIEHIFPQTPIGAKNIQETDFKTYIGMLNNLTDEYNADKEEDKKITEITVPSDWNDSTVITIRQNEINSNANKLIHRNSIGNLVLLNEKINRGYGNDFYTKKRIEIVKNPKGKFIRPHTLNPFIKGFLIVPSDLEIWTDKDIKANAEYIKKQITEFFNLKEENNEQE
jgi:hypothetical protein